jgi:hypothetical protein
MQNQDNEFRSSRVCAVVGMISAFAFVGLIAVTPTAARAEDEISFDGLVPVEDGKMAKAYIDPKADFSVYKRVKILTPYVAFKPDWQRDQNRQQTHKITASDMEKIKSDVASLFEKVFIEKLEAHEGFDVVDVTGDDVLLLRPAIIDLDIAAPDMMSPDRSTTLTSTAGAATLYVELFDSVSGHIIGRAADRQAIRDASNSLSWSNRAMNAADARRVFAVWADLLRGFLDQHYTE